MELKFDKFTIETEVNRFNADFITEILRQRVIELTEQLEELEGGEDLGNVATVTVPTTDPEVAGQIWLDGETLKVSSPV